MATNKVVGAALAALFSLGLGAQDPKSFEQRMAAAKLAQTRGDLTAALEELRMAQGSAPPEQQEQLQRAMRSLLDSQAGVGAQDPQGGDPVQRLIAVLDTGSDADPAVFNAYRQLEQLGNLMLPQVLAAFPKMGPFGMRNALSLLRPFDDARIVDVLGKRLDGADPAVTAAIANMLSEMRPTVSVPLAQSIAAKATDEQVLIAVLWSLMKFDLDNEMTSKLAMHLANSSSSSTRARVLDLIVDFESRWAATVLDMLRQRGEEAFRARATYEWLQRVPDLSEAKALQALQTMPAATVASLATDLLRQHPQWGEVAMRALRSAIDSGATLDLRAFDKSPWGKQRDAAGTLLLELPIAPHNERSQLADACMALIKSGWQVPAGNEGRLAEIMRAQGSGRWTTLVTAMPADAEDRAIAVWRELSPDDQPQFAAAANKAGRSWHRLFAMQLNGSPTQQAVPMDLLNRDWTGAPAAAMDELIELATRWPAPPAGWAGWQPSLVQAWQRTPDMPVEVILPLVESGYGAWPAFAFREPERALAWLRQATKRNGVDPMSAIELLRKRGGPDDVPSAIWIVHQLAGQPSSTFMDFFYLHARGNLDAIGLAKVPMSARPEMTGFCVSIASQCALDVQVADLDALLELVPALPSEPGCNVLRTLAKKVGADHAAALMKALEQAMMRQEPAQGSSGQTTPIGNFSLRLGLLTCLAATGNPVVLPQLRRLLADGVSDDDADGRFATQFTETCLAVAGDQRHDLLADMLGSTRTPILTAALSADELRRDDALRESARKAILRHGETLHLKLSELALEPGDLESFAKDVVRDDRFAQFSKTLARSALSVLGKRKDKTYLAELLRGATHPDHEVRTAAALNLGNTYSGEAAAHLLELLKDDSESVRKAVQESLDRIANYLDERKKWEERLK